MSETAQADPSGLDRTPTGELKDQQKTAPEAKTEPKVEPKLDPAKADADAKTDAKPSLLNEKDSVATGAPEKYEAFKAPEGYELDQPTVDRAIPLFKELGLSQEGAQKLIDFQSELSKQASEAGVQLWMDTQAKWVDAVKADPEIGHKLPEVKATISKAIDSVLGPALGKDFREAMDFTGAGNNPAFIKGFYKFAQGRTEGTHVAAGGPSKFGQAKSSAKGEGFEHALYPNLP